MQCVVGTGGRLTGSMKGAGKEGKRGQVDYHSRGGITSLSVLSPSMECSDGGGWRVIVGGFPEKADALLEALPGGWSLRGV